MLKSVNLDQQLCHRGDCWSGFTLFFLKYPEALFSHDAEHIYCTNNVIEVIPEAEELGFVGKPSKINII